LPGFLKDDLGPPIVFFHRAMDLHYPPLQLAYIADAPQVLGKNDYGEGTYPIIFAKVQIVHAPAALLNPHHFACNASRLTHMLAGLVDGKAISANKISVKEKHEKQWQAAESP
jgi:hypothetical protein